MNKYKRSWLRLVPLALLAFGSFNQALMANEAVVIAGGTTPQKDVLEPKAEALAKATGVAIKVNGVGTGNGMVALWEGAVTIATVGDTLAASVEAGKKAAKAAGKDLVGDNYLDRSTTTILAG